ncbi:UBC-like protein [Glarea lozoyensis ATCC 20868]|uniref:Ubiquitin-conjugating enzyme E2 2 n=1 Tax=Glarea lozoyensis (strain ATCC 20868 / MF5171) TaxID=1116229 RepID=S3DHD7_GLAL2|nr:UBC-like protein [Glarea lozoyensis ATCC 20868]EPE31441.1 UBC-like protein [Glarea lozoyensis ATCC 20868]
MSDFIIITTSPIPGPWVWVIAHATLVFEGLLCAFGPGFSDNFHGNILSGAAMPKSSSATAGLLARQFKEIQKARDLPGISCGLVKDNVFEWEVMLMINDDCKYYGGGNFTCTLTFPPTYPLYPPTLIFKTPIPFHPNIYPDGTLCISILHPPEEDKYGYESASERWSPVQSPETILVSTISLMYSPNDESPANVEAAKLWRAEKTSGDKEFKRRCRKIVRESLGED